MECGRVSIPQGEQPFSFASYNLLTISSQSENPDAAWRWIVFLTEQLPLPLIPARKSVAESDVFKNHIGNEITTVSLELMDEANFLSASMNWAERETKQATAQIESSTQPDEEVANSWRVVHQIKISHAIILAGFLNELLGISVGTRGEVHYTKVGK